MMNRGLLAKVLFEIPVAEPFDYLVPEGIVLETGSYVLAPLGKRMAVGVVWNIEEAKTQPKGRKLKFVSSVFPTRPMGDEQRKFIDFVGKYSCAGAGRVLRMCLPAADALAPAADVPVIIAGKNIPKQMTKARQKVLDKIGNRAWRATELAKSAGVSGSVIQGLIKLGALQRTLQQVNENFVTPDPDRQSIELTPSQQETANELAGKVRQECFSPILLDGITGSGKTEVYFEAVAEALRQHPDNQVLILLPEIALTQDILDRFAKRFGAQPAEWHSDIIGRQRQRVWRQVASGQARIVVGARSALFLPFAKLSLIVVDEEHDSSFKQEEGVLYHARDMAVVRASMAGCLIVLASATPSLETLHNAKSGRYGYLALQNRPGSSRLPMIRAIDLKQHPPVAGRWISEPLRKAMENTLAQKQQVLLYLNRRGYAPLTICRACGERIKSPNTDSYLVEHKLSGRLVCHLTGFSMAKPAICPACKAENSLHPVGPGVERLAEEIAILFPEAVCEVFSSDTTKTPEQIRNLISRMQDGLIDVLIGTQMAAKGHNFPNLTLVGVVDADMGLGGADLRAAERTYQTLTQVAGRAGRSHLEGRALLQTHQPEHEAIDALLARDRQRYVDAELGLREQMGFPPFGRLASVIVSASSEKTAHQAALDFAAMAPATAGDIEIWGPSEPIFAVVRGRWRRRLLVRSSKKTDLSGYMLDWRNKYRAGNKVRIKLDIDPYSFL